MAVEKAGSRSPTGERGVERGVRSQVCDGGAVINDRIPLSI